MLQSVVSFFKPIAERLSKLSKRESILLYILLIFIIIAGGVFLLLKPAFETHDKVYYQLDALQQQKSETDLIISQKANAQQEIKEYTVKVKELKKEFPSAMETEDVDTLVTGLVVKAGMRPKNMEITAGSGGGDAAAQGTQTEATTDQSTGSQTTQQPADTSGDLTAGGTLVVLDPSSTMKVNTATFSCEGSMAQFIKLVGLAHSQKGMAIRGFELTKQDQTETQSLLADAVASATDSKKAKAYAYEAKLIVEVYQLGQ